MFKSCDICGANDWDGVVYEGVVRSGSFGSRTEEGSVLRCCGCGLDRLDEKVNIAIDSYESDEYRIAKAQGLETADQLWNGHLESTGRADNLFMFARKC